MALLDLRYVEHAPSSTGTLSTESKRFRADDLLPHAADKLSTNAAATSTMGARPRALDYVYLDCSKVVAGSSSAVRCSAHQRPAALLAWDADTGAVLSRVWCDGWCVPMHAGLDEPRGTESEDGHSWWVRHPTDDDMAQSAGRSSSSDSGIDDMSGEDTNTGHAHMQTRCAPVLEPGMAAIAVKGAHCAFVSGASCGGIHQQQLKMGCLSFG
eukprot:361525-Chlamydomonas_euryale.AAC.11